MFTFLLNTMNYVNFTGENFYVINVIPNRDSYLFNNLNI